VNKTQGARAEVHITGKPADIERKLAVFRKGAIFEGLSPNVQRELAESAVIKKFAKDDIVFQSDDPCHMDGPWVLSMLIPITLLPGNHPDRH
jgi:hypothetical protein